MAFREKAAWAELLTTLVVWGGYFAYLAAEIGSGRPDGAAILGRFTSAVVLSIILAIISAIILAVVSRRDPEGPLDERERLVELTSTSMAHTVLVIGVVVVALSAPALALGSFGLFPGDPAAEIALIMANGVLLSLVLAEILRASLSIVRYRLGR